MSSARDRLLNAADRSFYANGINATGIDALVREAGVAKMSLYNNFASKDELVTAYLRRRHLEWLALLDARLTKAATASARVLAVLDAYLDHARVALGTGYRGCGLLNGAAELPTGHPGREVVREQKAEVRRLLIRLCEEAGVADPEALSDHLYLLVEGGAVSAGLEETDAWLRRARSRAAALLAQA